MAFKQFRIEDIGSITIYKRRGSRSLRLSVRPDGEIRVTIPTWTPYATGLSFAQARTEWIRNHRLPQAMPLVHGQQIGKAHRLVFIIDDTLSKVTTRVKHSEITVTHPSDTAATSSAVQTAAEKASIRALRSEAQKLLPIRLNELAAKYGFNYRSVNIKQLKTRWGSCDQDTNIVLNLFLMQLPWQLIDYVLLHELTHTRYLQHGPTFWQAMEQLDPNAKQLRKAIRTHQPVLQAQN